MYRGLHLGNWSKESLFGHKKDDSGYNMQKSKSSTNVGQVFSKKIWKSRSKSQTRPDSPAQPRWTPQVNEKKTQNFHYLIIKYNVNNSYNKNVIIFFLGKLHLENSEWKIFTLKENTFE